MPKEWEALFPQLGGKYIESSKACPAYNCAAFAVADTENWWEPFPPSYYYWPIPLPENLSNSYKVEEYVSAFRTSGYKVCADGSLEANIEKIAIYGNEWGMFEHAARQLSDGRWTSKIAEDEDIIHDSLDLLAGGDYGNPTVFMARPRRENNGSPYYGDWMKWYPVQAAAVLSKGCHRVKTS
jgi:hypothetical protein